MAVKRIVPNVPSPDAGDSGAFYVDSLGLEVAMDLGWIVTYAVPGRPERQISVMDGDLGAPVRPAVSIEVDDVDAVHAEVVRRGFVIVHPLTDESWGVRRFFVRDPGGTVVNILSHR